MTGASPTVRQRELGLRLRTLRTGLGLTVEDVAEKLMCSAAKISRMETGARRPILRDIRELCTLYNVDQATAAEFMKLTRLAREPGWWSKYDDLDLYPYIGLEQAASAITTYCMYWLPALVQTEEYARAIIKAIAPGIGADVHEDRVRARLQRQALLAGDNPPRCRFLIDEAAFRRPVGGSAVMMGQIDKVLLRAQDDRVTVQVIPFDAGAYSVADIMFTLLEFDERLMPSVVFIESMVSHQYFERPDELSRYRESIENVRDCALSPRDSARLLGEIRDGYAGYQK